MTTIIGNVCIFYSFQQFWYHMYTLSTQNKQDRQCTYDIILRRIHATIVWEENQYVLHNWVCICRLRYPACNAHVPYCHLWPARLYNIFPHYLMNGTIKKKKSYWIQNMCLIFSTTFVQSISHSKKNWVKYDQKCIFVFM